MKDNILNVSESERLVLTSIQRQVFEFLSAINSQKYSLADWYLGAIHVAKNRYNPDRFSQAAQSLRELLEKLPRVFVESKIHDFRPKFAEIRGKLYSGLSADKARYNGVWKDNVIDEGLDSTIQDVERYLQLYQVPTRSENIYFVISKLDPMHETLDQETRIKKYKRFHDVWKFFEGLAHHATSTNEQLFWQKLSLAERVIIDLLAPVTAQDQSAIREILNNPQPEQADILTVLELIKRRGANYAYFFKLVDNPVWINPLSKNGFFKNPLGVESVGEGRIIIPLWWPILYLQRISHQSPEQVVEIILSFKDTDNPRILREIFSIACELEDTSLSLRLKPLIMNFLKSPNRWTEEDLIIKILAKWGICEGPPRTAAYELIKYLIAFQSDPKHDEKLSRLIDKPEDWSISLEPMPRFNQWEYQQILYRGVRPLAEHDPYQLSLILIRAVTSTICLGKYPDELEKGDNEDYSEIWCPRLNKSDRDNQGVKEVLVQTLTYACEKVYDKAPESVEVLDQALRNHRWKVFKRLRQHLYASHPNDQTLPWIREEILAHQDYGDREHHYEFQLMIRKVSNHFGPQLLSADERTRIIETILSGPSREEFRERMGDGYSEEEFQQRQRYFHRRQLRPFATLLEGDVRRYFEELENEESAPPINDDSYSPIGRTTVGAVSYRSPKSAEALERLNDEELLAYLNDWEEERWDDDDLRVEINIPALAEVFQALFKEKILSDDRRRDFWLTNRDRIARPIYIAAMLKAMLGLVSEKKFDNLDRWIDFCAWVLSHSETARVEGQPESRDESREYPDWGSSRRAVVDFIDGCVKKDTEAPLAARAGIAALLRQACGQVDWRLDQGRPVLRPELVKRDDPITEALNNTSSRALESLVNFGFWIRRQLPEDQLSEVTDILGRRIAREAEIPLTRPEYAFLGMHFENLCLLDREWAARQRETLFPRADPTIWRDAFASYIQYNRPSSLTFEILRGEFEYALENLSLMATTGADMALVDRLGQHLFTYYLWEVYPLSGDESLLERFYEKTRDDRERWGQLFNYVGQSLSNSGRQLDKKLTDRIIDFFDWRFKAAEPLELQAFTFWLESECLDSDWRLQSYAKILDLGRGMGAGLFLQVRALNKMLPNHLALVVECFAKITDRLNQDTQLYISADEAKPVLRAGLTAEAPQVRGNAERARENLLRLGRFDFL